MALQILEGQNIVLITSSTLSSQAGAQSFKAIHLTHNSTSIWNHCIVQLQSYKGIWLHCDLREHKLPHLAWS